MKKLILPSMLALTLLASTAFNTVNSTTMPEDLGAHSSLEMLIDNLPESYAGEEETEALITFDINDYLPENFDVYKGMIIDESSTLAGEEISFDFEINSYLPSNFDVYKGMIIEETKEEEKIPFDFDVEDYLPLDFDVNADLSEKISM